MGGCELIGPSIKKIAEYFPAGKSSSTYRQLNQMWNKMFFWIWIETNWLWEEEEGVFILGPIFDFEEHAAWVSLSLHLPARFYVSLNCTLNWLFSRWMMCSDSTSAKSMWHFYLNDKLDSRSLQFIRHQYISFWHAFIFSFILAKTLSFRKPKNK